MSEDRKPTYEEHEALLAATQSQLKRNEELEALLAASIAQLQSTESLLAASKAQQQSTQSTYEELEALLAASKARLKSAQSQLKSAQSQLQSTHKVTLEAFCKKNIFIPAISISSAHVSKGNKEALITEVTDISLIDLPTEFWTSCSVAEFRPENRLAQNEAHVKLFSENWSRQ
jgi:hypothetical protein